ncbi:MAG: phosphate ABC transporter permease PstA [Rickettsiales bacterium]|nr:phosphate ABC transporter permease PstA [Rickettsiales bacterium]
MSNRTINMAWQKKRKRAERRFRLYGQLALGVAVVILVALLFSIAQRGVPGFVKTYIQLPITFNAASLELQQGDSLDTLSPARYNQLIRDSLLATFPEAKTRQEQRALFSLVSIGAGIQLKEVLEAEPSLLGKQRELWVLASSNADLYFKGHIPKSLPETDRKLSNQQISWLDALRSKGVVRTGFSTAFFSQGDSRTPEQAGFKGAVIGSLLTLSICLLIVFPIGVMTAIYLEEFASRNRWTDIIEVNINNLAAVPSIVFGLLGLAVYINWMGLPRSASLVGGMTLALMVLPVVIISTRAALQAVPTSIRNAARGLGASELQVVLHHTFPLALPGIMTGTILGMARAIGETAPLIMIGMVAFVADTPRGFTSAATVMPVQIYLWASSPETGFAEKTAAGILVLLLILLVMNALAIFLRKRYEIRW